jgi:hypothetical protein
MSQPCQARYTIIYAASCIGLHPRSVNIYVFRNKFISKAHYIQSLSFISP